MHSLNAGTGAGRFTRTHWATAELSSCYYDQCPQQLLTGSGQEGTGQSCHSICEALFSPATSNYVGVSPSKGSPLLPSPSQPEPVAGAYRTTAWPGREEAMVSFPAVSRLRSHLSRGAIVGPLAQMVLRESCHL